MQFRRDLKRRMQTKKKVALRKKSKSKKKSKCVKCPRRLSIGQCPGCDQEVCKICANSEKWKEQQLIPFAWLCKECDTQFELVRSLCIVICFSYFGFQIKLLYEIIIKINFTRITYIILTIERKFIK